MRSKRVILYLAAAILGGCLPSLHPLYTEKELIFEQKLIGKWSDGNDIWEFRGAGEKAYQMRVFDGKEAWFKAHLVKLDDMMFLDIFPDSETLEGVQDFYTIHLIPAHTFMKVDQIELRLILRCMNPGKVQEMLENDPNLLRHEVLDNDDKNLVLTASTRELQEFMIRYGKTEDLFGDAVELTRREPLYARDSLIFDESLTGLWEGQDGRMLDIVGLDESCYDITCIEENGTEHQFLAHLVEVKDVRLLAMFVAGCEPKDKDPNSLALVPDCFALVGQTEPYLLLWEMDYDEVAGMLNEDVKSPDTESAGREREAVQFQVFQRI